MYIEYFKYDNLFAENNLSLKIIAPISLLVHPGLHRPAHRYLPRAALWLEAGLRGRSLPFLLAAQLRGVPGPACVRHSGQGAPAAPLRGR